MTNTLQTFANGIRSIWGPLTSELVAGSRQRMEALAAVSPMEPWLAELQRTAPENRELLRDPEHGFVLLAHTESAGGDERRSRGHTGNGARRGSGNACAADERAPQQRGHADGAACWFLDRRRAGVCRDRRQSAAAARLSRMALRSRPSRRAGTVRHELQKANGFGPVDPLSVARIARFQAPNRLRANAPSLGGVFGTETG